MTDEATELVAGKGVQRPYAAPEVVAGHGATPMSDQYALAAIAYEWLFGRSITHNGERPIEIRSMPGVDRSALSKAFTRALAPDPGDRFASCAAFCDAIHGAMVPELPLLADVDDFAAEDEGQLPAAPAAPIVAGSDVDDLPIAASFGAEAHDPVLAQEREPDVDAIDRPLAATEAVAVPAWNPAAAAPPPRRMDSPRFGPVALFFAVIVGAVFGFAAGYMAKPRALQSSEAQQLARDQQPTAPASPAAEETAPKVPQAPEAKVPDAPQPRVEAPATATTPVGRLLVRSTPSGASVTVDGVARGVTPLALRDLDLGTRTVVVTRSGYTAETLRVSISEARPSRTLDVRLAAARPRETTPRPSTPATLGKPAVATGTLSVDSRPTGASVTINGKASGITPLTLEAVAPGEYRITMAKPGYQNFSTTVRVVAGERVRAAYSLTALEQQ